MNNEEPIKLIPASEVARMAGVCDRTMRKKISEAGVQPDAILVSGRRQIPLFTPGRANSLLSVINEPEPAIV